MTSERSKRPFRILDICCCAGGAAVGYEEMFGAVEITGIDNVLKKEYPYTFIKADILDFIVDTPLEWFQQFDFIHASPPCQYRSRTRHLALAQGNLPSDVDLMPPIRFFLRELGIPYVIENVVEAWVTPWRDNGKMGPDPRTVNTVLCGSSFDLGVQRHRMFESSFPVASLPCDHNTDSWPMGPRPPRRKPIGVYGSLNDQVQGVDNQTGKRVTGGWTAKTLFEAQEAMGITHITQWANLKEAVPPAYTMHIAKCFLAHLEANPTPRVTGQDTHQILMGDVVSVPTLEETDHD
jgi:DNA (cytosine-5)-methyltransferase 1